MCRPVRPAIIPRQLPLESWRCKKKGRKQKKRRRGEWQCEKKIQQQVKERSFINSEEITRDYNYNSHYFIKRKKITNTIRGLDRHVLQELLPANPTIGGSGGPVSGLAGQETRKELPSGMKEVSSRAFIGVKRMGELDNKSTGRGARGWLTFKPKLEQSEEPLDPGTPSLVMLPRPPPNYTSIDRRRRQYSGTSHDESSRAPSVGGALWGKTLGTSTTSPLATMRDSASVTPKLCRAGSPVGTAATAALNSRSPNCGHNPGGGIKGAQEGEGVYFCSWGRIHGMRRNTLPRTPFMEGENQRELSRAEFEGGIVKGN